MRQATTPFPQSESPASSGTQRGVPDLVVPDTASGARNVELELAGMTCASCAARIEKKLNKLDGVNASVNYATEMAHIVAPAGVGVDELIATVEKAGYSAREPEPDAEPVDHTGALRRRLIVAVTLSVPVIVLSMVSALQFPGWQWVCLVLATPVVGWSGIGFHRAAWVNARHGATTMDTLVSVGTIASYVWSLYALVFGSAGMIGMHHTFSLHLERGDPAANIYLEAAVAIVTFVLIGRYIEARSRQETGSALDALMRLGVREVTVVRDGVEHDISVSQLQVGDRFLVSPGATVATDGVVVDGTSALDASLVTGEALPVEVRRGSVVVGGSVNTVGLLVVRATAVGAQTQLARIAHLVASAQSGKANAQRLADKVSSVFVPIVIALSLLTLVGWLVAGRGWSMALGSAIAVLIIACPCALGLATPTALLAGTGRAAELGILIRGPQALERARNLTSVLFDKTGTLTTGAVRLTSWVTADADAHSEVVHAQSDADPASVLVALERGSQHPIARALVSGLSDQATPVAVREVREIPGGGIEGTWVSHGSRVQVLAGTPRLFAERGVLVPQTLQQRLEHSGAAAIVLVGWDGQARALALLGDSPKPDAVAALERLRSLGLRPILLTGDTQRAADALSAHLVDADGRPLLAEVLAGQLPEDKAVAVRRRQADGERVAMVGDGVNDAAALAAADLGIAMGSGSEAARVAGDITLLREDLGLVAASIQLSRRTLRTIQTNLVWAFLYNVLALPIAAAGLLNPMVASAAMSFSSVFVVLNSVRLRRTRMPS